MIFFPVAHSLVGADSAVKTTNPQRGVGRPGRRRAAFNSDRNRSASNSSSWSVQEERQTTIKTTRRRPREKRTSTPRSARLIQTPACGAVSSVFHVVYLCPSLSVFFAGFILLLQCLFLSSLICFSKFTSLGGCCLESVEEHDVLRIWIRASGNPLPPTPPTS